MRLLLDTHVLLWWLADDPALSPDVRKQIASHQNLVYVSAVSVWEIVVKQALGKLAIAKDWADALEEDGFRRLPVTWEHALRVGQLPDVHRDPFDRLLVAQAAGEDLVLVTHDRLLEGYGVPLLAT